MSAGDNDVPGPAEAPTTEERRPSSLDLSLQLQPELEFHPPSLLVASKMEEEVENGADGPEYSALAVEQGEEDEAMVSKADVTMQAHHGGVFGSTLREKPPFSTIRDTMDWIIGLVGLGGGGNTETFGGLGPLEIIQKSQTHPHTVRGNQQGGISGSPPTEPNPAKHAFNLVGAGTHSA